MTDFLQTCEEAAREGGAQLLRWIGKFAVREKGPADLVTEADLASQEAVRRVVLGRFPQHGFIGEEQTEDFSAGEGYCWVVDPLDGTTNYVHGVPHYAVSVALVRAEEIVAGAVFDPQSGECFTAENGGGAYLSGQRIQASGVQRLSEALVVASLSAKLRPDAPEILQCVAAFLECQGVRRTGSAALNLCYVAAGRFDAFWALNTKAWDVAAGALLVREAGGAISDLAGRPFTLRRPHPVATATSELLADFLRLLQEAEGKWQLQLRSP